MELHAPQHLSVVAIEKGALESLSTKITYSTYFTIWYVIKPNPIKPILFFK